MPNNTPIPDAELAEVKRLHAAATQGRWRGDRYDETVKYWIVIEKSGNLEPVVQLSVRGDDFGASEQDCDWIMAAHNTFPGILARLEAAERERDELASVVKSPEYRQMLADLANLPARDAQQQREGAAKGIEQAREMLSMAESGEEADEMMQQAAKRLREGGE